MQADLISKIKIALPQTATPSDYSPLQELSISCLKNGPAGILLMEPSDTTNLPVETARYRNVFSDTFPQFDWSDPVVAARIGMAAIYGIYPVVDGLATWGDAMPDSVPTVRLQLHPGNSRTGKERLQITNAQLHNIKVKLHLVTAYVTSDQFDAEMRLRVDPDGNVQIAFDACGLRHDTSQARVNPLCVALAEAVWLKMGLNKLGVLAPTDATWEIQRHLAEIDELDYDMNHVPGDYPQCEESYRLMHENDAAIVWQQDAEQHLDDVQAIDAVVDREEAEGEEQDQHEEQ
jgi:hypothetical protein